MTRLPRVGERIYLSPPDITDLEKALVMDALDSGWVAPLGPHVDAFEDRRGDITLRSSSDRRAPIRS